VTSIDTMQTQLQAEAEPGRRVAVARCAARRTFYVASTTKEDALVGGDHIRLVTVLDPLDWNRARNAPYFRWVLGLGPEPDGDGAILAALKTTWASMPREVWADGERPTPHPPWSQERRYEGTRT
jgi:hypothetical protein